MTVSLLETRTWERFCRHIGRPDLVLEEGWSDRHSSHGDRAPLFRKAIAEVCLARDRDALVAEMLTAGISICPVYDADEALASPEAKTRGVVRQQASPTDDEVTLLWDPLARAGLTDPTRRLPPAMGEQSDEIRRESRGQGGRTMNSNAPQRDDRTLAFAEDMVRLGRSPLAAHDQEQVRRLLLDLLGVSLCGSQLPWTKALADWAKPFAGSGKAPVVGTSMKVSPFIAALVNGTAGARLRARRHARRVDEPSRRRGDSCRARRRGRAGHRPRRLSCRRSPPATRPWRGSAWRPTLRR